MPDKPDLIRQLAELFRTYGYEGASIGIIVDKTGAGRSSLYHFFPGGKADMARAVLADIDQWFEAHIFTPLRHDPPETAIAHMFHAVTRYFHDGQRICLVGAFALDQTRDQFAAQVRGYFRDWQAALAQCLERSGLSPETAQTRAIQMLAAIQGGIVLARATGDNAAFTAAIAPFTP
ncbi:TetR/AcrR family transcriptional regulator [Thioclava sp. GXIMD4216]|uniref:TetR/AcrR family transcriptional regulator n=1 Tax=Thioclava sp. GXIMD4216 TaxID=3131929 RepID=UPI0030CC4F83